MSSAWAFHHVQLAIPPGSEERCRAFWSGILGLEEIAKPVELAACGGCWFRAGAAEIHLGVEPDFRPSGKAHPGFIVMDLIDVARRLTDGGVEAVWDERLPGFDRFYCADPFGNRLEFMAVADPS